MRKILGRVVSKRNLKNGCFIDLICQANLQQVFVPKKLNPSDILYGDILEIEGEDYQTKLNIPTIRVRQWTLCIRPRKVIRKKQQVNNIRRWYLNGLNNGDLIRCLKARSTILFKIRDFLINHGFMEIETPILEQTRGSMAARPIETKTLRNGKSYVLKRSGETYHKRIIMSTICDSFEISRVFRDQGASRTTMAEYNMLDIYKIGASYLDVMDLLENLLSHLVVECQNIGVQLKHLQFPIPKISLVNFIEDTLQQDILLPDTDISKLRQRLKKLNVATSLPHNISKVQLFNWMYTNLVKPRIKQATFIYDFPNELCPLGKPKDDFFAEEFRLLIDGVNVAHGYTECTEIDIQREALLQQYKNNKEKGLTVSLEEEFLESMEYGFPPMAGVGLGLDRFFAIVLGYPNVRHTKAFPFH
ncbi:amino acid--tRNA ligase-related protein [Laceyella tengchongensis]|uniref:amino acid--tRNA ligase-related protein n=1 Tax=Laceyella tengchongensis TaxID=574699 RepID=UPI0012B6B555|nr:hypothetical protein [Laceyella tengchongensis]